MPNRILDGRAGKIERTGIYKPFVSIALTLLVALSLFRLGEHDWMQQVSTLTIAVAFLTSALVISVFTEDWTWRASGLLVAVLGTGLSYMFLFLVSINYFAANTSLTRSTLRASLFVGGVILFIGIIGWAIARKQGSKQPLIDTLDPRTNYRK